MKKILFVVYSLDIGGLERIVVDLANSLDPTRYVTHICCIAHPGVLADEFKYPEHLIVIGHRGRVNYSSCKKVYELLVKNKIDVIHSHNTAGLFYSFIPAKLARVPIVHTIHGYVEVNKWQRLHDLMEKWMSKYVNKYVCVSYRLRNEIYQKYMISAKRMIVLYNGVKILSNLADSYRKNTLDIVIASVGRLTPVKNYSLLLQAFSEIAHKYSDCRLEFIGEGDEYSKLVELRDRLSLQDKVFFKGEINDVEVYLKSIDIFVLTSLYEGISMSMLEALSMKKICIASEVGGNSEIIQNGVNGFLFESRNKWDLVEKLSYVIENIDKPEMNDMRVRAQETVKEKFSFDAMVKNYCDLYEEITLK